MGARLFEVGAYPILTLKFSLWCSILPSKTTIQRWYSSLTHVCWITQATIVWGSTCKLLVLGNAASGVGRWISIERWTVDDEDEADACKDTLSGGYQSLSMPGSFFTFSYSVTMLRKQRADASDALVPSPSCVDTVISGQREDTSSIVWRQLKRWGKSYKFMSHWRGFDRMRPSNFTCGM